MNKKIIVATIVTVLILGAGLWLYLLQQKKTVEIQNTNVPTGQTKPTLDKAVAQTFAEKILKLIQNRDYSKIYDFLTDADKVAENKTDYVKRVTETSGATIITSWQIKEVLEEKDGASIQYVANYNSPLGSGSETGILNLVQKNGKWFLFIGAIDTSKAIIKSVGDEIVLATIKFKINTVNERQTISTNYGSSATAREGTKFVVVDMTITNLTKTGETFPVEVFQLTDNQDRNFETYKNTFTRIDNYLNLRQLPPSIPERGVVVYEIPIDAIGYSFTVAKAGTSEVYKIILK